MREYWGLLEYGLRKFRPSVHFATHDEDRVRPFIMLVLDRFPSLLSVMPIFFVLVEHRAD
jgi:hypothetical protein